MRSTVLPDLITGERDRSEDAEELARTDPLTGLPHRRVWDSALAPRTRSGPPRRRAGGRDRPRPQRLQAAQRPAGPPDRRQDVEGSAAAWGPKKLRAGDLLARVGGDDFAALVPRCEDLDAARLTKRMRDANPAQRGRGRERRPRGGRCPAGPRRPGALRGKVGGPCGRAAPGAHQSFGGVMNGATQRTAPERRWYAGGAQAEERRGRGSGWSAPSTSRM